MIIIIIKNKKIDEFPKKKKSRLMRFSDVNIMQINTINSE